MTYFLAPYVNSYKRFVAGSFAPTNLVWSRDNRTSGFRVLGHGPATRIECRVGGADVNPYLAFAAFLAAACTGSSAGWTLAARVLVATPTASGDVPSVPRTLREAIDRLDGSTVLRDAFGDEVIEHYRACRSLGTGGVRQGRHRLGTRALFRARLDSGVRTLDARLDPWPTGRWLGAGRPSRAGTRHGRASSVRFACFRSTAVLAVGVLLSVSGGRASRQPDHRAPAAGPLRAR